MKIYYQYSKADKLFPAGGDFNNEIGICTALSQFAQVYYAGKLFNPLLPDYGLNTKPQITPNECDVAIVRANDKLINQITKIPVYRLAIPVNPPIQRKVYMNYTLTDAWKNLLINGIKVPGINPDGNTYKNTITIKQVVLNHFGLRPVKKKYNFSEFTIGCFGRIVASNHPEVLLSAYPIIKQRFPDINIKILFGTRKPFINNSHIITRSFAWDDMPNAYSSCDLIMINSRREEYKYAGSTRLIEPMRCGMPIVLQDAPSKRELLGNNYEGFIPFGTLDKVTPQNTKILADKLIDLIWNKHKRDRMAEYVYQCSEQCTVENRAKEFKKLLKC